MPTNHKYTHSIIQIYIASFLCTSSKSLLLFFHSCSVKHNTAFWQLVKIKVAEKVENHYLPNYTICLLNDDEYIKNSLPQEACHECSHSFYLLLISIDLSQHQVDLFMIIFLRVWYVYHSTVNFFELQLLEV